MTRCLADCVLQLHSVNEVGQEAKDAVGTDFMKMVHVEKQVVKIQALFRQRLAMRKLEKDVERTKARLAKKQNASRSISNEEVALQELK